MKLRSCCLQSWRATSQMGWPHPCTAKFTLVLNWKQMASQVVCQLLDIILCSVITDRRNHYALIIHLTVRKEKLPGCPLTTALFKTQIPLTHISYKWHFLVHILDGMWQNVFPSSQYSSFAPCCLLLLLKNQSMNMTNSIGVCALTKWPFSHSSNIQELLT